MSKYPECEKLQKVAEKSQVCGDFLNWLSFEGHVEIITRKRTEELLAEYFKINLNKIEKEKQAMLDDIRKDGR